MDSVPLLSLITFAPALGALLLAMLPDAYVAQVKQGALVVSLLVLAASAYLFVAFEPQASGLAFYEDIYWIMPLDIRYQMGLDGISLVMVVLTAVLTPLAMLCSWQSIDKQVKGFFVALLVLETGMIGVFSAADLFLFYVFWELMLLPMALLIGIWGGARREYAAIKFVIYTLVGSLMMFVAILYCYMTAAAGPTGGTFNIAELAEVLPPLLSKEAQLWLFAAFGLSFAIKVPMFPFHTWLPDAHVEAPTAGSVILAGVLLKMGSYGFLRFGIPFFPVAAAWFAPIIVTLSVIGIIYGSLMAMAQGDIKKLIAYSSVAHLGFVMLGIFAGNVAAAQGGVLQMVNHGVSTGALFLLVGIIYDRAHTRGVNDFGGLAKVMPIYAVLFLFVALSSIGLPGLNGFVGEFLVLNGTFQTYPVAGALSALGVVLAAAYMLTLYRNVFFGAVNEKWRELPDTNVRELVTLAPLVILILWLGVLPNTVLQKTEGDVTRVVNILNDGTAQLAAQEVANAGRPD